MHEIVVNHECSSYAIMRGNVFTPLGLSLPLNYSREEVKVKCYLNRRRHRRCSTHSVKLAG